METFTNYQAPYNDIGTVGTEEMPDLNEFQIEYEYTPNLLDTLAQGIKSLKERVEVLEAQAAGTKQQIFALNSLRSAKLQLKKPLSVVLKETPEGFISELGDIAMWGHGDTEDLAIENLCTDLENLYFFLKKEQKKLSKEMRREWEFMQEFIKEV